jgi:Cu-Zn family superoxide dismutase
VDNVGGIAWEADRMKTLAAMFALALVLAACATGPDNGKASATANPDSFLAAPTSVRAQAAINDAKGAAIGLASFAEDRVGVRVDVRVRGLIPGLHGIHVHAVGKCEGPAFATAGAHFNPNQKQHGGLNPAGPHAGDLGNIEVKADGTGTLSFSTPLLSLAPGASQSVLSGGGLAVVIHAQPDDDKTDPSGNSGDRVACGVVKALG